MPRIDSIEVDIIPEHEVFRSVSIGRGSYVPWLGAGASVEAGVKSGAQICAQLRRELASFAMPDDEDSWARRELAWDDPKRRYSACLKKYGSAAKRVLYFRQLIQGLQPCFGHHAVALLMDSEYLSRTCLTTNFDKLIELAFAQQGETEYQAIRDDTEAGLWRQEIDKSYVLKLHGDYDMHNLLNTTDETVRIPAGLQRIVVDLVRQRGMIVLGSSGYEESVMRLFNDLLDTSDPTVLNMGLYWGINVGPPKGKPLSTKQLEEMVLNKLQRGSVSREVLELMDLRRKKAADIPRAFFPASGAGQFLLNLINSTNNKALIGRARRYLDHRMRLRHRFALGGLSPEAVEHRLSRLDEKEHDRRSAREFQQRSKGSLKVWTAHSSAKSQTVDIVYGDITSRSFMASTALGAVRRAVISPEDTLISAGGGVALALLRKAGQHILLNELSKFDEVRHGEVVVTSGCELPVAYIFHVAATLLRGDGSSLISESDVSQAVVNILSIAKSLDVRGLFMPLIGAGLEGMPPRRSLSAILQGIAKAERFATDELVQVAVVIRDEGTISRQEVGSCLEALASSGFDLRDCFADSATLSEE